MSTLPQCQRFVTALTDETAYGTAIVDGSMTAMFHLVEPAFGNLSFDIQDSKDLVKGHEFNDAAADAWQIIFQDGEIPFSNVPLSAEFVGWMSASLLGTQVSSQVGTTVDYDHIAKLMDKCVDGDQLPSRTIGIVYSGSTAVNKKYKGCVANSGTIRVVDKGRVTGDLSFLTDGTESDGSSIAIPASFDSENFYFGSGGVTLEYDDFGGTYADESAKLRSFELTMTNGLLLDEAKTASFATLTNIDELRTGTREITCTLTLLVDESSQEYADAVAGTEKMVKLTVAGPTLAGANDADMIIEIPRARWMAPVKGYDGTRRTIAVTHDFYWDTTADTPVSIQVTTGDPAYL
jgi:hypothetical protein